MQAKETKLQDILEGTKQYVVPLFQRTYSWEKKEWDILWNDIKDLCESDSPKSHFIGSIVNMPTISVPEGVAKFLLIDGQQRVTTIFIILTLLRNKAIERDNDQSIFAREINDTLLVNPFKADLDHYKLIPTQVDRDSYKNLIDNLPNGNDNQITNAYRFYEKKLRQASIPLESIKKVITSYFSVVSIVLDVDDNPYLVFESLNAKGRPLSQADLIRNYIFMRVHVDNQEQIYKTYWQPMQDSLKDLLTEFMRHFLMKDGVTINKNDVYYALKAKINQSNAIDYLKTLLKYSKYYKKLTFPESEDDQAIQKHLIRLNRIEVTTAYPFLLNIFDDYHGGSLSKEGFIDILRTLENYLIRRFVCGIPTNQLNKIFPVIYSQLKERYSDDYSVGIKALLQTRSYPRDIEFKDRLIVSKLYGAGDRTAKTKLILESIEECFNHKEAVPFDDLSIEHVMPQTLSDWWQNHLGADWDMIHELHLHNIGNLTLTAYNAELSNSDFDSKKQYYSNSHLELNKYFAEVQQWNKDEIEKRSEHLADIALNVWPYFGQEGITTSRSVGVTGTTPTVLRILGQHFNVKSWRDVFEETLNTIADLEPDKFDILIKQFPRFLGKDKTKFRSYRELENGTFIEVNLSAQSIQRFCYQAIETIELTADDWMVETI